MSHEIKVELGNINIEEIRKSQVNYLALQPNKNSIFKIKKIYYKFNNNNNKRGEFFSSRSPLSQITKCCT